MVAIIPPAEVEVDDTRHYIAVDDSACQLLGYSREELLRLRIR
jgi:PAS domain-containing protein